jgi:hypothetical protein
MKASFYGEGGNQSSCAWLGLLTRPFIVSRHDQTTKSPEERLISLCLSVSHSDHTIGLVSKEKNVKKQNPQRPHEMNKTSSGKRRQTSAFDEELNNLKARSGIFTNKKTKKPQVITLAPSILTSKVLQAPIEIHAAEASIGFSVETNNGFVTAKETNIFNVLQEPDPASFKMMLKPSLLAKFVPGSTIDESDI